MARRVDVWQRDDLDFVRGVLFAGGLSLVFWAAVAGLVWWLT